MADSCKNCGEEYDRASRKGKPGLISICNDCAELESDIQKYTGNMIFSHKTAPSIQINKDPRLTAVLNGQMAGDTEHQGGACIQTADAFNYKGRDKG